ncbi:Ca-activated chloride channel homolog [Gammaproteobacteria bacterium]
MIAGFDFQWPWLGLLWGLPWLVRWLAPTVLSERAQPMGEQRVTLLHPYLERLRRTFPSRRPGALWRGRLFAFLVHLLWMTLVLALMQPQWLTPKTQVSTLGYDIMLVLDTSHSMDSLDFTVNGREVTRLSVVKGLVSRFIEGRKGDRVGLVVFGSQAFLLAPLTTDRAAVLQLVESVESGIAGTGTALGDGLALGVQKLRERPAHSRVLIVMGDGDNNQGVIQPQESARFAHREGVRIHAIGVGTTGAHIPIWHQNHREVWDDLQMEEKSLREIVTAADGSYYRATDVQALESIYARINEMEKTRDEVHQVFVPDPLYRWPLGAALVILLWLGLWPGSRRMIGD